MQKQQGVTLVELLVSLALSVVLIGAVIQVLLAGQQSYQESQRFSTLQSSLLTITDFMMADIRSANNATITNGAGVGSDIISLILPNGDVVLYRVSLKNELARQVGVEPEQIIAENIDELNYQCMDGFGTVLADCTDAVMIATEVNLLSVSAGQQNEHRIFFRTAMRNRVMAELFD